MYMFLNCYNFFIFECVINFFLKIAFWNVFLINIGKNLILGSILGPWGPMGSHGGDPWDPRVGRVDCTWDQGGFPG